MIDSVAAVLGLVSVGIFLAHAIESYRAYALVGAEARFTSVKQGMSNDRRVSEAPAARTIGYTNAYRSGGILS
jgi:hypothetical protein